MNERSSRGGVRCVLASVLPPMALLAVPLLWAACASDPTSDQDGDDPYGWVNELPPGAVVLGRGEHVYLWQGDWLDGPRSGELGNTHGDIVVSPEGLVLFNTDTERAVMAATADGRLVQSWGADYAGGLHGMDLVARPGAEPTLWMAHTARHEVLSCDLDGTLRATIGWPEASGLYASADEYRPTSVVVTDDDVVIVADGYGKSWIHRFTSDGRYLDSFGGPGEEPGQLRTPHGLHIDRRGEQPTLVVADRENHRLQVFDLDGRFVKVIDVGLRRPCNVDGQGEWLVVPDLAGRVTILDGDDQLVLHLGDNPDTSQRANNGVAVADWQAGLFLAPHAAAWDADGNLYVMDWNRNGRMTRLQRLR